MIRNILKIVVVLQFLFIGVLVLFLLELPPWSMREIIDSVAQGKFPDRNKDLILVDGVNKPQAGGDFFSQTPLSYGSEDIDSETSLDDGEQVLVDLSRIREASPLSPQEIFELTAKDDVWGYFKSFEERHSKLKEMDPGLSLVNYRSDVFRKSKLAEYFKSTLKTRVYALLEFDKPISTDVFYTLKRYGFDTVPGLRSEQYYGKSAAVFYVSFGKIRNIANSRVVKSIHILEKYTALAKYQLGIKSSKSIESLELKINYPYSKPGLSISDLDYSFKGNERFAQVDSPEKNQLTVITPITAEALYLFSSEHKVAVDLNENVKRSFYVAGKGIFLAPYRRELEKLPAIKEIFTRQGEKIVTSDYVDNILSQINTDMDISGIWKQISFILDKDIEYDWQKRELFFSGNLTYYDIKDMYLNVAELSEKKVGACTERTSLEIAILRKLGIAARSATRLYHIFTEVYVPEKGWVTTSLILNEIPLCHSYDENMAYFVEWSPNFPIRLKWLGGMTPGIVSGLFESSGIAKR